MLLPFERQKRSSRPVNAATLMQKFPFDHIFDRITGCDSSVTDYVLEQAARCPNYRHDVVEKTLIEPA
jgi:hypothetical protein